MKASSAVAKSRVSDVILGLTAEFMKESGKRVLNAVKGCSRFLMEEYIKVNMKTEKAMGSESWNGLMDANTKGNSKKA